MPLTLPYDLANHPPADTIKMLTGLLERITKTNDKLHAANVESGRHTRASAYTCFHARSIPNIDIHSYLNRILKYCPCANECFLSLLVYFDRMSRNSSGLRIDSYNIHRLVISGIMVASKFFSDIFFTNSRYAKVGGLPVAELNALEIEFLQLNDYNLSVSIEELQQYGDQLFQHCVREEDKRRDAEYKKKELRITKEDLLVRTYDPRLKTKIVTTRSSSVDSTRNSRRAFDNYTDRFSHKSIHAMYSDIERSMEQVEKIRNITEGISTRNSHSDRYKSDAISAEDKTGTSYDDVYDVKAYSHRHTWHLDHRHGHRLPSHSSTRSDNY